MRSFRGNHRFAAAVPVKVGEKLPTHVLLPCQHPFPAMLAGRDLCRVGAKKEGCVPEKLTVEQRKIQRDMVAFQAPTPGLALL
jgi:hypothetical protein